MINTVGKKPLLFYTVLIIGFTSIVTQILLMRELVVVFFGNELSLGVILGVWLFWTAIGSGLLSRKIKKINHLNHHIGFIQLTLALVLPFILIFVRSSKELIGITLGEMIGFTPMLFITLISLAPFCLPAGLLYTVTCQYFQNFEHSPAASIGKVYLLEALGSGIGGLITSFLLIQFVTPAGIFLLLSLINLISAILVGNITLFYSNFKRRGLLLAVPLLYGFFILCFSQRFQTTCDKILWKGYNLVSTRNTIFGNLSVIQMENQISFFENGLHLFTAPDQLIAEESVHFALLEHPNPSTALLIGGGLGGGIGETLRHPSIQEIDYVEIDPMMITLAKQFLTPEQIKPLNDPRVTIYNTDGRLFIKKTSKNYDVIILYLPNPYTAQINRYYTLEFYREVERILKPDGIFAFQVNSSENAISPELSDFLSTLSSTLASVFPDMIIIPGETNHFIVSTSPKQLTSDPQLLVERLQSRHLQTQYVREYYLPYRMTQEREEYLQSRLHPVTPEQFNRDYKPIGYYYDTILWATVFSGFFKKVFLIFSRFNIYHLSGFFILFTLFLIVVKWRPKRPQRLLPSGILYSTFTVGLSEISLEVTLILSFQILYGYIYHQLAVIITGYMTGLALGSGLAILNNSQSKRTFSLFRKCQFFMTLYPIAFACILRLFQHHSIFLSNHQWLSWTFPLIALGAGFIGGFQFPLANRLYLHTGQSTEKIAGTLYSVDLIGSSIGAMLTSAFLLPLLGILTTLYFIATLNLCCLIVLILSKEFNTREKEIFENISIS